MNSETYKYKSGANQVFSQSSHVIIPSKFTEEEVYMLTPTHPFLRVASIFSSSLQYIGVCGLD